MSNTPSYRACMDALLDERMAGALQQILNNTTLDALRIAAGSREAQVLGAMARRAYLKGYMHHADYVAAAQQAVALEPA